MDLFSGLPFSEKESERRLCMSSLLLSLLSSKGDDDRGDLVRPLSMSELSLPDLYSVLKGLPPRESREESLDEGRIDSATREEKFLSEDLCWKGCDPRRGELFVR